MPAVLPREIPELGIDIIRVDRIARVLNKYGARFEERIFTTEEREYVRSRAETAAEIGRAHV